MWKYLDMGEYFSGLACYWEFMVWVKFYYSEYDSETNPLPFSNNTRQERSKTKERNNGNESTNSFPLRNGSFFSRGSRSESTSSDPKSFEPLPSVVGKLSHYSNEDVSKQSLEKEKVEENSQTPSEGRKFADIFNFWFKL